MRASANCQLVEMLLGTGLRRYDVFWRTLEVQPRFISSHQAQVVEGPV